MINPFEIFTQKPDKAPFKEWKSSDLKGGTAEFFELPEFPDRVIRKFEGFDVKVGGKMLSTKEAVDYWGVRGKELKNFSERYGIKMARTNYFVGNDPRFRSIVPKSSRASFMAETDKISGKNLEEMKEVEEKAVEEIDAMFSSLFTALRDSYEKDEYWWGDYGNRQVMYGTAPKETESHVYIVDVDPRISKWSEYTKREQEYTFWHDTDWVFNEMRKMEKKYAHDTKPFENARKSLAELIEKTPVPEISETAVDLREQLMNKIN